MDQVRVFQAEQPCQTEQVARLLRDYLLWLRRQFAPAPDFVDDAIDPVEWESELADLNGHFGAPHGAMLLATFGATPAGCALMRGIGKSTCEITRLFASAPPIRATALRDVWSSISAPLRSSAAINASSRTPVARRAHRRVSIKSSDLSPPPVASMPDCATTCVSSKARPKTSLRTTASPSPCRPPPKPGRRRQLDQEVRRFDHSAAVL